jgi:nucleoside-diphosphate-sugar epimerase
MTILVTGASGFVGRHLVAALLARGYRVLTHSYRDGSLVKSELRSAGVDHVFHLGARSFVPDSWVDPPAFYEANVLGAAHVMEFCRISGASVTLVSSYVYGRPKALPVSEDHQLAAFNPYGHSKIMAEEIGRYYQDTFAIELSIVRPFNIYGPGQASQFLIPSLINQALSPDTTTISVADARPKRDYLYVTDFIDLLLHFAATRNTGTFNAGSGTSASIQEVVDAINLFLEKPKPLVSRDAPRPDEVFDLFADIGRASEVLGWTPGTSLIEGLERTIVSMRDPGNLNDTVGSRS